ncbi:MAG: tyrosyl-tRNA synthetase [Candidatus Methanomethylophilaceae archaeon]|nr:tyrosyl-tRNA synthetase [Candidatus Methanomethylophilaceae archaeon]MDI3541694.1 tyrosyl-tRNA synthetase [Candidatus Methanomethylophilaceae archaeon]
MDLEERFRILTRNVEELVTEDELRGLLSKLSSKNSPRAYIGFEPSGLVHIGWLICASKIRDLVDAGFQVTVFWADWHAYINDKLGGDIDNIRTCARYMEDCFEALGVPRDKVEYRYASDILNDMRYWEKVIKIAKVTSLSRVRRAMTIMGRSEDDAELDSSKLFYPILQAADIFAMEIDLAYSGMDQRRAHMLARDAAEKLGWNKPIAMHTPLLPGLRGGNRMDPASGKMSKSDPDSGIMIHDSFEDIKRKLRKAYCPPEREEEDRNPVLMLYRLVLFPRLERIKISRPEKFGGSICYDDYTSLREDYFSGELHPADLKDSAALCLALILAPVKEYFDSKPENYESLKEVLRSLGR